ncbi:MAG: hypothetical protein ACFB01_08365 [Cohaesibacteraceae bacterium]
MSANVFKLIELFLFFGAFFAFCLWQIRSVDKSIAEDKARKAEEDPKA